MLLMSGVPTSRYNIAQEASSLRTLWVDHNRLSGCLPASWSYLRSIKGIDMRNNQLDCSLSSFLAPLLARKLNCHNAGVGCSELRELDVSQNHLYGSLPNTLVAFRGLSLLDVHSNNLTGTLPVLTPNFTELGAVLTGLRSLAVLPDGATSFGATQAFYQSLTPMSLSVFRAHDNPLIHGSIPESYGKLPYLDTLTVYGTAMQAPSNQLLPNFLKFSSITTVKINYLHLSCSLIVGAFRNMTVEVSGKYTNWDNCECDPGFYGRHGECVECPPSCPCLGSYLTGCYPSLRMDNKSSAEPSMSILPCPRFGMTTQAATACNPDERPEFVCAAGHKNGSFMCSECSSGYFSTGYACSKCTTFLSDALPAVYVMCAVLRWVSCCAWVLVAHCVSGSGVVLQVHRGGLGAHFLLVAGVHVQLQKPAGRSLVGHVVVPAGCRWARHHRQLGVRGRTIPGDCLHLCRRQLQTVRVGVHADDGMVGRLHDDDGHPARHCGAGGLLVSAHDQDWLRKLGVHPPQVYTPCSHGDGVLVSARRHLHPRLHLVLPVRRRQQ